MVLKCYVFCGCSGSRHLYCYCTIMVVIAAMIIYFLCDDTDPISRAIPAHRRMIDFVISMYLPIPIWFCFVLFLFLDERFRHLFTLDIIHP